MKSPAVRQRYGVVSGVVGILCNALLCTAKIAAGLLTGAVSIVADGINNLSDGGSCVVSLLGFKMAGKPADDKHPFGHAESSMWPADRILYYCAHGSRAGENLSG